jgi:hypothetical protein
MAAEEQELLGNTSYYELADILVENKLLLDRFNQLIGGGGATKSRVRDFSNPH